MARIARMRPFLTQNGQATFYARISRKNYARYASGVAAPLVLRAHFGIGQMSTTTFIHMKISDLKMPGQLGKLKLTLNLTKFSVHRILLRILCLEKGLVNLCGSDNEAVAMVNI